MRSTCSTFPNRRGVRGFSTVAAVFLVVVLALLGAAVVTVFGLQQTASSLDLQGARALRAAQAGIEWGMYQVLVAQGGNACPASPQNLTFGGTLSAFTTTVTCSSNAYDEAGNTVRVYAIISTAQSGTPGTSGYVERQLTATVALCTAPGGGAC